MRKCLLCVGLAVLFASSTYAAPVGPGGRIYYTSTDYRSTGDNVTRLHRVDVDTGWNVVTDFGEIATVTNNYAPLAPYGASGPRDFAHKAVTSPEILHRRANADGTPTGGDGSVFLAGYYDSNLHTRYYQVSADGATVTTLHPGVGQHAANSSDTDNWTGGEWSTAHLCATAYVVDPTGAATGQKDSVFFGAGGGIAYRGHGLWRDTDVDDDLSDETTFFGNARYIYNGFSKEDAEIGGRPGVVYSGTDDTIFGVNDYNIWYQTWTGSDWANEVSFYLYADHTAASGHKMMARSSGIAVGDTDGDGNVDVYALCTDTQGSSINGPTIFRMADLDGSGRIDYDNGVFCDLFRVIYDNNKLGGTSNDLGGNADLELIHDPTTGDWTLLVFDRIGGRIIALELSDNGDFAGGTDAFKVVISGIDAGGSINSPLYGMEFDADVIPEPGTLLLIGSGVLGLVGYMRRKKMG